MSKKLSELVQNKALEPEDNPVLQGNFAPVMEELSFGELEVEGTLPPELCGTLLRNGPNPVNPEPNHHWFSGDAMLHAIKFADGKALSYRNRWVRTAKLEEQNGLTAASVCPTELIVQGSGNVNVIQHGDRVLALPEVGFPYELNLDLDTKRQFDYDGLLPGSMTAHPKIDGKTGEMIFFGYEVLPPFLRYHRTNSSGELMQSVEITIPEGVMMHDFGVTETRAIFMDLPIVVDLELLEDGFNMPFRWDENHQARLGIMLRDSNVDDVKWIDIDPCYVFHPLNSYDDGENIVMDVVRYQKLFTPEHDSDYEQSSQLVRWLINPTTGTVESTLLNGENQEFPRLNPNYECYPYRYGYSVKVGGKHGFQGLLKHDLLEHSTQYHDVGDDCAAGEAIFVPTGEKEDEGYLLSVIYNGTSQLSEVWVIDAQDFCAAPVAIVKLGTRVPFGFHGNFATS